MLKRHKNLENVICTNLVAFTYPHGFTCTSQLMLKFKIFNLATARSRSDVSLFGFFDLSAFFAFECFSLELR